MKLKIYLFRHGQTYYNQKHIFTGWKDSKLTPLGLKQAQKIALKLQKKKIDLAYQTHLSRSKDTLKPVLKYHPECQKVITDDRIIERSYGKLQGHSHQEFQKEREKENYKILQHWSNVDHLTLSHRRKIIKKMTEKDLQTVRRSYRAVPPNGESIQRVEKRVKSFIKDLLGRMKKEKVNVAISAHGNSMRPFRRYFEHLTIKEMMQLENPWDDYFEYTVETKA